VSVRCWGSKVESANRPSALLLHTVTDLCMHTSSCPACRKYVGKAAQAMTFQDVGLSGALVVALFDRRALSANVLLGTVRAPLLSTIWWHCASSPFMRL